MERDLGHQSSLMPPPYGGPAFADAPAVEEARGARGARGSAMRSVTSALLLVVKSLQVEPVTGQDFISFVNLAVKADKKCHTRHAKSWVPNI